MLEHPQYKNQIAVTFHVFTVYMHLEYQNNCLSSVPSFKSLENAEAFVSFRIERKVQFGEQHLDKKLDA